MPVTTDIVASYRGPGRVIDRLLSMGEREDRALAFLMGFCGLAFVAQLPGLSRKAHLTGEPLDMLMGGALLGSVIILPLALYIVALLSYWVIRLFGGKGTAYGARLALFWALLASTPMILFHGLVAGFIGEGPALTGAGLLWAAVFLWFWVGGLRRAHWGKA